MKRVLVVDDNADIRSLVVEVLRMEGVDGEEVDTGVAALERLGRDPLPDLVVLDVQMPQLDGWDTLRRIRKDPRTASIPVVLCTVKSGVADMELAWELETDGFVMKPFPIDQLVQQVTTILRLTTDERSARRQAIREELERTRETERPDSS